MEDYIQFKDILIKETDESADNCLGCMFNNEDVEDCETIMEILTGVNCVDSGIIYTIKAQYHLCSIDDIKVGDSVWMKYIVFTNKLHPTVEDRLYEYTVEFILDMDNIIILRSEDDSVQVVVHTDNIDFYIYK